MDTSNGLIRDLEEHYWNLDDKELSKWSQRWRHWCPMQMLIKEWSQPSVILVIWPTRWPILCMSLGSYTKQPWRHRYRFCLDPATWTSTHQDQSGYSHCWIPNLPTDSRDQPRAPSVAPLSRETSQMPAGRLITLDSLHFGSTFFFFNGIGGYSGYGFVFSAHSASVHITLHGLTEDLIYCRGISHSIASDQGTHFTANEVHQWVVLMEVTGPTRFPIILKHQPNRTRGMATWRSRFRARQPWAWIPPPTSTVMYRG